MNSVEEKYGDSFCCAPWNTVWTGSNGDIKFCCASVDILGNVRDNSIEEIYNSNKAKELRVQFLRKEKPEGCSSCWEQERGRVAIGHARWLSNQQGQHVIDDSIAHTLADGTTTKHNFKFVDLIWTNKCNFSCLHCVPWLSSTIATSYKDVFPIWLSHDDRNTFETFNDPEKFNNTSKLEFILKHIDSLEEIHFNGGEPFLQTETFTLLEELIKNPAHKNIKIWFHTNGSVRTYKNVDIVDDYLKRWQGTCHIVMSHDHFGERGEYFRYGYKEDKWLENFWRFVDAGISVSIDISVTLFNALTLDKLCDWYKDQEITNHTNFSLNYVHNPEVWNFLNLGYFEDIKNQTKDVLTRSQNKSTDPRWINMFPSYFELLKQDWDYSRFTTQFKPAIIALDNKRDTNFLQTYPELQSIFERVQ